jgi:hypothetical protein
VLQLSVLCFAFRSGGTEFYRASTLFLNSTTLFSSSCRAGRNNTPPQHQCYNVIANFMTDTLNDFKVMDRITFIKFLDLLRKDFLDNPENWENKTLPDFLEAMSAYTEDIQGYYENMKQNVNADKPEWSTFADIFKGATIYE